MNFSQYIIAFLAVQTVRCNTVGFRTLSNDSRTEGVKDDNNIGIFMNGNTRDFAAKETGLIAYDVIPPPSNNDIMTSSELLHAITSPKFSLQRVRRGAGSGKSRRRQKCDPTRETCRRRKKNKNRDKKRRRCKKGKKGRRKCRKTPKTTPKPPPIQRNITQLLSPGPYRGCIRSTSCPENHCCARHHYQNVCKPMKKEGDICTRPRRKNRRSSDHLRMCECESHLACKKKDKKSRLYTCQSKT